MHVGGHGGAWGVVCFCLSQVSGLDDHGILG